MIKWLKKNVLGQKKKRFRVFFIYKNKQKVFLDIYEPTPAKAVKEAKMHIKKYAKNKKNYKFAKVEEL